MKRVLAISDIHGKIDLLDELLSKTKYAPENDQLILLGDYVDRGPNSMEVLERVIELEKQGAIVLKGNHEDMMIKALTTQEERPWKHWVVRNGGDKTLQSYGFSEKDYMIEDDTPFSKPILETPILDKHLQFIQRLNPLVEYENYIFVHAGLHPTTPIHETDPYIHMWIREEFHKNYEGEKTVVFGHTPARILHGDKQNHAPFFGDNNIIGIDGGAVYGGQLNCLLLPKMQVVSVS